MWRDSAIYWTDTLPTLGCREYRMRRRPVFMGTKAHLTMFAQRQVANQGGRGGLKLAIRISISSSDRRDYEQPTYFTLSGRSMAGCLRRVW